MAVDLTKLKSTSLAPAFKNNDESAGSFVIGGSFNTISKIVTKTISLPDGTDEVDIMFRGRADGGFSIPTNNPRDNDGWFKRGVVYVRSDGGGLTNYPMPFNITARVKNNILTIEAVSFKQFVANMTLTDETVHYRVLDYSVF